MARKYCPDCGRNVEENKHFSVFFCLVTVVVPYLIYYAVKKGKCSMCGCKDLQPTKSDREIQEARRRQN